MQHNADTVRRINVDNKALPRVQSERTLTMGNEQRREAIYFKDRYVGEVVYVARRTKAGTEYGWRPAKSAAQSKLTSKVDAIRRLPQYDGLVADNNG